MTLLDPYKLEHSFDLIFLYGLWVLKFSILFPALSCTFCYCYASSLVPYIHHGILIYVTLNALSIKSILNSDFKILQLFAEHCLWSCVYLPEVSKLPYSVCSCCFFLHLNFGKFFPVYALTHLSFQNYQWLETLALQRYIINRVNVRQNKKKWSIVYDQCTVYF